MARGMRIIGCHGVLPQEKHKPQEFKIDVDVYLNLREAALKDDLSLTVDYAGIFNVVRETAGKKTYNLIEALAEDIAENILANFPVQAVEVTVYKPSAPVEGSFDYFAVKIKREV